MRIQTSAGLGVAALVALPLVVSLSASPRSAPTPTPTFAKDVAPILYRNCTTCHRPGEIAPMSLLTYDDARPYAKAIRDEVTEGHMPPWHADAPAGTFENERKLTGEEKHTVPAEVEFLQDTIVYGLFPHTHLRGKAWDYKLVLPDGTSKSILAEDNSNSKAE